MQRPIRKLTPALLSALLVACGGGGSSNTAQPFASGSADETNATTPLVPSSGSAPSTNPSGNEPPSTAPGEPTTSGTTPPSSTDLASPAFVYDESARFNEPGSIAADVAGNLYVLDSNPRTIRKISTSGEVSTLPTTIVGARELKIDSEDNLYTIEGSDAIRKIAPDGSSTALAQLPHGAWWMTESGRYLHVLVTDGTYATAGIFRVTPGGEVSMSYSGAPLNTSSRGIAADGTGNLYVGNRSGQIFKFPTLSTPTEFIDVRGEVEDLAFDPANNLYVSRGVYSRPSPGYCSSTGTCEATVVSSAIFKIAPDGTVTQMAYLSNEGNDTMTANQMGIARITIGPDGNLYAAYNKSHAIYKIAPDATMTLIAGKPGEAGNSD